MHIGEDLHSQKQLTYFLKPSPSAGQRVTENGEGGALPTPIQDLDIRELFSYKLSLSFLLPLRRLLPCTE